MLVSMQQPAASAIVEWEDATTASYHDALGYPTELLTTKELHGKLQCTPLRVETSMNVSSGESSPQDAIEILLADSASSSDEVPASAQATLRSEDVFSPASASPSVSAETAYESSAPFLPLHLNATMTMNIFGGHSDPASLPFAEHCVYPAAASHDHACFPEHWQAEQAEAMGSMPAHFIPFSPHFVTLDDHAWHQYGGDCWGMSTEASDLADGHWHQPGFCAETTHQPTYWNDVQYTN